MANQSSWKTCFLCNDGLFGFGARRVNSTIPLSETTLTAKIEQLLGDNLMIVVGQDDKLCIRCYNLLVKFNQLESDLESIRRSLKGFLNVKYNLENFTDNTDADDPFRFANDVAGEIGNEFTEESKSELSQNAAAKTITDDVQIHRVANSPRNLACGVRDHESPTQSAALAHLRAAHDSTVAFKCATCDRRFGGRAAVRRHVARAHGAAAAAGNAVRYRCGLCSATYPERGELVDHFRVHRDSRPAAEAEPVEEAVPSDDDPHDDEVPPLRHVKTELEDDDDDDDRAPDFEAGSAPSTEMHECSECGKRAYCEREMRSHVATAHGRRHRCPLCDRLLSSGSNLRRHLERHGDEPVVCRLCRVTAADKLHLREHVLEAHPRKFECSTCRAVLPTAALLRLHESSHGANCLRTTHPCATCGKLLSSATSLRRHELTHERPSGPVACVECGLECVDSAALRRHSAQTHGADKQRRKASLAVPCDKCVKVFPSERRLQWHKDLVHRPPGCRHCGKVLTPARKLIAHERRHLLPSSHPCADCGKTFKTATGLMVHSAVHTGHYRFVCAVCGKGSQTSVVHDEHMATHTKECLYTCDRCGRGFSSSSTLRLHRLWHDRPFPYSCPICRRKFRHSSLLAVHKRRAHTGERPYACPHCPLAFAVSGARNKHAILHTRDFPHRCAACGRGVTTRAKLARHLAQAHGDRAMLDAGPRECEYKMVLPPEEAAGTEAWD